MAGLLDFLGLSGSAGGSNAATEQPQQATGFGSGVFNNPMAMIGFGSGLLGGSWTDASKGMMLGMAADSKRRKEAQEQRELAQQKQLVEQAIAANPQWTDAQKAAVRMNPQVLSNVTQAQLMPKDEKVFTGPDGQIGRYNPNTGKFETIGGFQPGAPEIIRTAEGLQRIANDPNKSPETRRLAQQKLDEMMRPRPQIEIKDGVPFLNGMPITNPDTLRGIGLDPNAFKGTREALEAREKQDKTARDKAATQNSADLVLKQIGDVERILDMGWLPKTGPAGEMIANRSPFPSGARDIRASLESIKANITFAKLAEMRANSPTGAAMGNLTEKEGERLAAAIAALDQSQSDEQFRANLRRVKDEFTRVVHGVEPGRSGPNATRDALRKKYGLE